ncbi:MAG: GAF domain-containing protein [Anaerolineae bacterium]|nr:MAG: GAF domain-containing protein [Anaerolineae bacterium]
MDTSTRPPQDRHATLLYAAARVAKSITSILDPEELLQQTVDLICDEFDFYYAGVFLVDSTGQWAVLRSGRGEAGRKMIAEGHKLAVGGNSMIGSAIQQRQARIALDVGEEAVFFKNPHLPHTRSEMALPLIVRDEAIGALTVQSTEEAAFSEEDIAALQTMADQLAVAIHNANLHRKNQELLRQAERRARLLRAANQVGKQVTSILSLDELLPHMVDIICEAYGFYYAGIFLVEGDWAVLRAGYGKAGEAMLAEKHKLKVGGNSMIGAAVALGEARIALDVGEERVHFKNPHLPHTRSEMALPLMVGDEVLGAVTVQSVEERAFSQDDITTLQTMADHLAVAIKNAQNIEALKAAHAELVRTKVYEALTTATTEAIHWIGNKALPITLSVARIQEDLQAGEVDVESLQEDLEIVAESARLIMEVKEQLIGQAREQKPRPCMLADVAQSAAIARGIPAEMFTIEVAPETPLALADTSQLTRAFGNLLVNAQEAEASHIRIHVRPAEEKGFVALDIHDDGVGMDEATQAKVWTTFYTTKGPSHHGLGLTAALHIITQLQGQISLESQPGKGTSVHILLPQATNTPAADISGGAEHILLLDDDDPWANFFGSVAVSAGKIITHRSDAQPNAQAHLILVDEYQLHVPLEDILQVIENAGLGPKTIILTTELNVERTTTYLKRGIKDVMLKPYTLAEIAQVVHALA